VYFFLKEIVQIVDKTMRRKRNLIQAAGYVRTSSATNVGQDKDSEARQRAAIERFAKSAGYEVVAWFYDPAVKGEDPIESRPGFSALLDRVENNGVKVVLIEDASRLARKTVVQELGVLTLNKRGISLLTSSGDDLTETDDEGRIMMRQIAGAFAEYEKRRLVRKLREARERSGHLGGRKTYAEKNLELVELARNLYRPDPGLRPVSLRKVSAGLAERGFVTPSGRPYSASAVASMLAAHYRKLNPGHAPRR
jgi:DNA invertase Pin-like site-specific DNA recombinase